MAVLWSSEDKVNPGITCSAEWKEETRQIEVTAKTATASKTEVFVPEHEPRFGIDVADLEHIYELAGRLSDALSADIHDGLPPKTDDENEGSVS